MVHPTATRAARLRALVALTLALASVGGCRDAREARAVPTRAAGTGRCDAPPAGDTQAFLADAGEGTTFRFTGTVTAVVPPNALGFLTIEVREGDGRDRALRLRCPDGLPIVSGRAYTFALEQRGESPKASALQILDADGLTFAAVSDVAPGATVLAAGPAGLTMALVPGDCQALTPGACEDSVRNVVLHVAGDGAEASLMNGERARVGRFDVHCLVAQRIAYLPRCADAARFGVSYTIARAR